MALNLTLDIVSPADVNRLNRELSSINDFFVGAKNRRAGSAVTPPKTTQLLDDLAKVNKLNLLEAGDRAQLGKELETVQSKAPKLQISFAVEPSPKVVQTILKWLRENLNPKILLQVGLQPNIGAGCVIRTPNKEFDLSMRQHLMDSKKQLALLIQQAVSKVQASQPTQIPVAAVPAAPVPTSAPPVAAPTNLPPRPLQPRPVPARPAAPAPRSTPPISDFHRPTENPTKRGQ